MNYTYIIYDETRGIFKIGKSKNVKKRFKQLRTGNLDISLVLVILEDHEKYLHQLFNEKRYKGEWFLLNRDDLTDLRDYQFEQNKQSYERNK